MAKLIYQTPTRHLKLVYQTTPTPPPTQKYVYQSVKRPLLPLVSVLAEGGRGVWVGVYGCES